MPAEAQTIPFTAIVMAARRGGNLDPLAAEAGVSHKALVPIVGKPLIEYVLRALADTPGISAIRICMEPEAMDLLRGVPGASGEFGVPVEFVASGDNLADSAYLASEGLEGAILITTADNVNMTPDAIVKVMQPVVAGADASLGVAERKSVIAARMQEDGPATAKVGPYALRDGRFSNCNLYFFAGRHVMALAEAFREGGQFSKKRKRMIKVVGYFNILLFLARVLTIHQAIRRLGRRFGMHLEAVVLEDGAQAVDVDNPNAYKAAEAIIRLRTGQ
ncbi:MAG TPA: nucleotidyl transferase [Allosphingosinicella sp.]